MRLLIQFIITLSRSSWMDGRTAGRQDDWQLGATTCVGKRIVLSLYLSLSQAIILKPSLSPAILASHFSSYFVFCANQLKRHLRKCCQGKLKLKLKLKQKRQHECLNERINEDGNAVHRCDRDGYKTV